MAVDGERIVPLKGGILSARRRMLFNGVVIGSFVTDAGGRVLGNVKVSAPGLFDDSDAAFRSSVEADFFDLLSDLPPALRIQDAAFTDAARAGLRRIIGKRFGKRPIVEAHMLRI
jgi:ribonuclease J